MSGWIKCSERLPTIEDMFLIWMFGTYWFAEFQGGDLMYYDDTGRWDYVEGRDCTHWMPLPPAPTEDL